ncbi:hypothetical protein B4P02_28160, partial [Escherichia coli]
MMYSHASECIRGMTNTHPVQFSATTFDENKIPRRNLVFLIQKMMLHSILFTQILKIIACYLINNIEL